MRQVDWVRYGGTAIVFSRPASCFRFGTNIRSCFRNVTERTSTTAVGQRGQSVSSVRSDGALCVRSRLASASD